MGQIGGLLDPPREIHRGEQGDPGVACELEREHGTDGLAVPAGLEEIRRGDLAPVEEGCGETASQDQVRPVESLGADPGERVIEVGVGVVGLEAVEPEPAAETEEDRLARPESDRLVEIGLRLVGAAGQRQVHRADAARLPERDVAAGDRPVEEDDPLRVVLLELRAREEDEGVVRVEARELLEDPRIAFEFASGKLGFRSAWHQ